MNVGKLYQVKKMHWYVFPTQKLAHDLVLRAGLTPCESSISTYVDVVTAISSRNTFGVGVSLGALLCGSCFVLLDGSFADYKRILMSDGSVGWIFYTDEAGWVKDTIVEVSST